MIRPGSDNYHNSTPFLPLFQLRIEYSVKHCQRHNGSEGWVHLSKVTYWVISQVQTQILIKLHEQYVLQSIIFWVQDSWTMFLSQLKKIAFEVEVGSPLRQAVRFFQPEIHHHARLPNLVWVLRVKKFYCTLLVCIFEGLEHCLHLASRNLSSFGVKKKPAPLFLDRAEFFGGKEGRQW